MLATGGDFGALSGRQKDQARTSNGQPLRSQGIIDQEHVEILIRPRVMQVRKRPCLAAARLDLPFGGLSQDHVRRGDTNRATGQRRFNLGGLRGKRSLEPKYRPTTLGLINANLPAHSQRQGARDGEAQTGASQLGAVYRRVQLSKCCEDPLTLGDRDPWARVGDRKP